MRTGRGGSITLCWGKSIPATALNGDGKMWFRHGSITGKRPIRIRVDSWMVILAENEKEK